MSIESPNLSYFTNGQKAREDEPRVHDFPRPRAAIASYALQTATKQIDNSVLRASKHFSLSPDSEPFKKAAERLNFFVNNSHHLIDNMALLYGKNVIDYFRLMNARDFAVDSAAIHAAFSSHKEKGLRTAIADGLAGISIAHMGLALKLHGRTRNEDKQNALRGVIAEQLALTLTNLSENPDRIAIPASLSEDRTEKTDLKIYHFSQGVGYVTPAQVKSNKAFDAPYRGININQYMLGRQEDQHDGIDPSRDFQLARSLVALMNADDLGDPEKNLISQSTKQFEAYLDALLEYPGNRTPLTARPTKAS